MQNGNWQDHLITDEEKKRFEEDGYFIVENAIPMELVSRLETAFAV